MRRLLSIFTFTGDSAGAADPITLPSDMPDNCRQVKVSPPSGHSWTVRGSTSDTAKQMGIDEVFVFTRLINQGNFQPGETIGFVVLDNGTGTFTGECQ